MSKVFLLLGGNEKQTLDLFSLTKVYVEKWIGNILVSSSIYKSEPWGFKSSNEFLNQVLIINSALSPKQILNLTQKIEIMLGRKEKSKESYTNRPIDIDILFFNNEVYEDKTLSIPHPKIQNRKFTLKPLNEIAPDLNHPILNKKITELLEICQDHSMVETYYQKNKL